SRELCGGTHLAATGQIGSFVVISDASIGAGLRRIEALTGRSAEAFVEERLALVNALARRFRVPAPDLAARVDALEQSLAEERKRGEEAAKRASAGAADELAGKATVIGGVSVLIERVAVESADALRPMAERLRQQLKSGFITLAAEIDGRPNFIVAATDDVVTRGLRADEMVKLAASIAGGGGGGRPQMAQAGGRDATKIGEALEAVRAAATERLSGA
ncbi:MAG: DHHA1 domain-containing protein, partial [Dehalococcoidia bacterium]|nr:DHHA1 domain-containing protein [Dehalococcoidia bacterium]